MIGEATRLAKLERTMNQKTNDMYRDEVALALFGCGCSEIKNSETRLANLKTIYGVDELDEFKPRIKELIDRHEKRTTQCPEEPMSEIQVKTEELEGVYGNDL